ncbi:hypothetical protein AWC25_22155 [Mycobacterium sherrisii]|nr:hypothetical protein AWC25_22155 [Mycobacterium sherrisii]
MRKGSIAAPAIAVEFPLAAAHFVVGANRPGLSAEPNLPQSLRNNKTVSLGSFGGAGISGH